MTSLRNWPRESDDTSKLASRSQDRITAMQLPGIP
jgi:hypothetical protein